MFVCLTEWILRPLAMRGKGGSKGWILGLFPDGRPAGGLSWPLILIVIGPRFSAGASRADGKRSGASNNNRKRPGWRI